METIQIQRGFISGKNTYTGQNAPKYIVIHETDNNSKGAGAARHAQAQSLGHLSTSVHYYSGSDGIYQAAEHIDGTYSIGIEYGGTHTIRDANNRNTINIEICVNSDGNYTKARQNAIELVKYLIKKTGIPAERVIRHFDAKGKYCPRKMMDNLELWEDFKRQISGQDETVIIRPEDKDPEKLVETNPKETWYRVGSDWKDGICQKQTGAYHNRDFAIADCKSGQKVYDENGKVIYTGKNGSESAIGDNTHVQDSSSGYTQKQFVLDVQKAIGVIVDGIVGDETFRNTITVSASMNRKHPVVMPIQKRLDALGYDCGTVDGIAGQKFTAAVNSYQKKVLGYQSLDGEVTAGKKMWKSLLGMI